MRIFAYSAFLCILTSGLHAQDTQGGFHSVACIKVEPGKGPEFRQFATDATRKIMQAWSDSGEIAGWYLFRTVIPAGNEASCNYVSVTLFRGVPPEPRPDRLSTALKTAGIGMTAEQYIARRNALSHLVSSEIWRTAISVGTLHKGDYAYVNLMKVHNLADYMELERTLWKPMAQTWVEEGNMRGWMVNLAVLPAGTEIKYQVVTLDVFPSWDAMMKPRPVSDTFKKVHPGKNAQQEFGRLEKARDLARRELIVLEESVTPSGGR